MATRLPMGSSASGRTLRFGAFEFDVQTGELRKHGLRVRLQGQPVEVLMMLLQQPGELVTREELQRRLWSGDTYVDFEQSLNAVMKRLRAALGDSADAPRFVETIARRGYRFIAPVGPPAEEIPPPSPAAAQDQLVESPAPSQSVAAAHRWVSPMVAAALVILIGILLLGTNGRFRKRNVSDSIRSLAVLPLANLSGDSAQDYFV